jgi:LAO/AO transport system kinase
MRLIQPRWKQWAPPVELCSAISGDGISTAWETVGRYRELLTSSGELSVRRAAQACRSMWSETTQSLLAALKDERKIQQRLPALEADVMAGRLLPGAAAQQLLAMFRKR